MSTIPLSLETNDQIKAFFEGKSDEAPISEFRYVHTHFIQDNFLSDIEIVINVAATKVLANEDKYKAFLLRLGDETAKLADLSGRLADESTHEEYLLCLRRVYQLCKKVQ